MKTNAYLLLSLVGFVAHTQADPTWPSSIDELEEIMFQTDRFSSRKFADVITPCSKSISGPGRRNAAEWVRTAFHDMATANIFRYGGGLDASLQYDLGSSENKGPAFQSTLLFMAPYLSRKSSMADLIALGVYASVVACQGPSIDFRSGRIDATESVGSGVPQPENDIGTFRNQFARLGFSPQEMIQATACGHTLGGVHSDEFPEIVPSGAFPSDVATLDSTDSAFDNNIVTEYLNDTTKNPLVRRFGTSTNKNSDFKVYNSDGNVTMNAMADAATFKSVCKTVFEKMINVVPSAVQLTDPIKPYQIKPVSIQLTLQSASTMLLSGYIRVRTTRISGQISGLTINYKTRNGNTNCGSGGCTIQLEISALSKGLEDTFSWYQISQTIPTNSGISSFTVTVNGDTNTLYDNNGNGYPVQDGVFLQKDQSCLNQNSGVVTVVAAVRNDRTSLPVKAEISYKTNRDDGNPVPMLRKITLDMVKGDCRGSYTFYTATTTITADRSIEATFDVISGDGATAMIDSFKKANILAGTCQPWNGGSTCSSITVSSAVPSSTSSSAAPTATLSHRNIVGGYKLVSCWTEASAGRALKGAAFAYDGMTLETCMKNCTGFDYWGTEYGRECYCGNSLDASSTSAPLSDCSFTCSGDSTQYCGAGSRLELYSTTVTRTSTATPSPTATLTHVPKVGKYSLAGCQTEAANGRALQGPNSASDDMTLEKCASFCSDYAYFGTEYGRECYCGNSLQDTSKSAPLGECNMKCAGNQYQYCGDGNRLDLYRVASTSSSTFLTSTVSATTTSSSSSSRTSSAFSSSSPSSTSSSATISYSSTSSVVSSGSLTALASSGSSTTSSSATVSSILSSVSLTSTTVVPSSNTPTFVSSTSTSVTSPPSARTTSSSTTSSSSSLSSSSTSSSSSRPISSSSTSISSSGLAASSTTTSSATSTVPTLAHKPTVSSFNLTGCWTEGNGVRALSQKNYASGNNMTLEYCASFCADYKFFGTEYSSECYCGNALASSSSKAPLSDCSMTCSGNKYEYCGGPSRLTLYESEREVVGPKQPATIGAYTFVGCRTEAQNGRALSQTATASNRMTNEMCAQFCDGFTYFGTEYSGECYCGTTLPETSLEAPASDCNMVCSGDSSQYCGSGNRLSVYKK